MGYKPVSCGAAGGPALTGGAGGPGLLGGDGGPGRLVVVLVVDGL